MLNTTEEQRKKRAQEDERKKLILELVLFRLVQKQFRKYSKEYKQRLTTGGIASTIGLQLAFEGILKTHYKRVADDFSAQIIGELGKPHNHALVRQQVESAIDVHAEIRSKDSAKIIAQTTHKEAMNSWVTIRDEAIAKEETLTAEQHAARAQLHLDKKLAARTSLISNIETQNPAEHAKQTELNALHDTDAEVDDVVLSKRTKEKQWQTMLDSHVREWHAEAEGQIVPFNEPFEVNGENLLYPGDMSLGASLDNVAGCRCALVPIIR